jgi:hypothetical protein
VGKSPDDMMSAVTGSLAERTGRSLEEWLALVDASGTRAASRVLASREQLLADAVSPLTPGERKALTGALEKVLDRITSDRAHADLICRLCDLAACPERACPVELAARGPQDQPAEAVMRP